MRATSIVEVRHNNQRELMDAVRESSALFSTMFYRFRELAAKLPAGPEREERLKDAARCADMHADIGRVLQKIAEEPIDAARLEYEARWRDWPPTPRRY